MNRPDETFTLQQAADDSAETLDLWACEFFIPAALHADAPACEMAKRMQVDNATGPAKQQGYELVGEPLIDEEPVVWLRDWNDGRGGLVGYDLARRVGYDGEPTAYRYVYRWGARKKPADG